MEVLSTVLQLVGAIASLIILHEIGHFLGARLFKIEVEEFGIGFPPRILTLFKMKGTRYTLNWLPLGGFVRIKGEGDPTVPGGLAASSPWVRLAVYAAGPLMNLLAAVVLYAVIAANIGMPDPTQVMILDVSPGSPAEAAGLQAGDIILEIDGEPIDTMERVQRAISARLGKEIDLTFQREEQVHTVRLVPRENPPEGEGAIGIMMGNPTQPIEWFQALPIGAVSTFNHSLSLLTLPADIVRGSIAPEDARPVGYKGMFDIYQSVQEQEIVPGASKSLSALWFFTTVTISLGVFNLLPIPALDGGRMLFTLPEIIFRRRIPAHIQNAVNAISFALMILLFFYINYLDFANPIQLP